jgi:hypothetical protein
MPFLIWMSMNILEVLIFQQISVLFQILKIACDRYIELHPDKKYELEQVIVQYKFVSIIEYIWS